MRINCHAHTFNFRSVFSPLTIEILLRRIGGWSDIYPSWVLDLFQDEIEKAVIAGEEYSDWDTISRKLIKAITDHEQFEDLLDSLKPNVRLKIEGITMAGFEDLASDALGDALGNLARAFASQDDDARKKDLKDLFEFLRIGLQPSIRKVTDIVMPQLGKGAKGDALVTLTLDVTKGDPGDQKWQDQIDDTSKTVLDYPGRIFPFVCVNTLRQKHFEFMERAIVSQGFVGVKLYPSLGYDVDSEAMDRVYAFCAEREVPVLMHCNRGGFYNNKTDIERCDPALWSPILDRHPDLKFCFGHFGGGPNFTEETIDPRSWTGRVLEVLENHDNAYADISFHTDQMEGGEAEASYFRNLKALIGDPRYRKQILFGSDFFMVRQQLQEKSYWEYYEDKLNKVEFKRIALSNAYRFLGLPRGNRKASPAIENYVRFLWENKNGITLESPAPWLEPVVKDLFGDNAKLPKPDLSYRWDPANRFHVQVYKRLRDYLPGDPKFKNHGGTAMLRLSYWRKGIDSPTQWQNRLLDVASELDQHMLANQFAHKGSTTVNSATKKLMEILGDPSTRIWEVAELAQTLYRSTKEVD